MIQKENKNFRKMFIVTEYAAFMVIQKRLPEVHEYMTTHEMRHDTMTSL